MKKLSESTKDFLWTIASLAIIMGLGYVVFHLL